MGAPWNHARKPGTGQIRRQKNKWLALKPQSGPTNAEDRLGLFATRWAAERALDRWLRETRSDVAE